MKWWRGHEGVIPIYVIATELSPRKGIPGVVGGASEMKGIDWFTSWTHPQHTPWLHEVTVPISASMLLTVGIVEELAGFKETTNN